MQHLQADPPLWGEAPRSAWSGHQAGGGLAQRKCPPAEGRSGLFTTSRPGWTPCRNGTPHAQGSPQECKHPCSATQCTGQSKAPIQQRSAHFSMFGAPAIEPSR